MRLQMQPLGVSEPIMKRGIMRRVRIPSLVAAILIVGGVLFLRCDNCHALGLGVDGTCVEGHDVNGMPHTDQIPGCKHSHCKHDFSGVATANIPLRTSWNGQAYELSFPPFFCQFDAVENHTCHFMIAPDLPAKRYLVLS